SDVVTDAVLKEYQLQRLRPVKPQKVDVDDCFDSLRQFHINAAVVNKDSGIYEICLSLRLTASQTRQETVRLDQTDTSLRQTNSIPHPERKLPTNKIRIV